MRTGISSEQLLHLTTLVLRKLVDGGSAPQIGTELCRELEQLAPDFTLSIMILDSDNQLRLFAASDKGQKLQSHLENQSAHCAQNARCAVIDCQHALAVQDNRLEPGCTSCYLSGWAGPWSCWSYPILDQSSVIGCLRLTLHQHGTPSAIEAQLLDNLASIAGMLLCFQRNQRQQHLQAEYLQRAADFQNMLAQANALVANATHEPIFLHDICHCLAHFSHLPLVWICKPNAEGIFEILTAVGATEFLNDLHLSIHPHIPEGRGSMGTTWREAISLFNDSFANERQSFWQHHAEQWNFHSNATLPIFRNHQIWAVLVVIHYEPAIFDFKLKEILEELAKNMSRGLDQIHLRERESRLNALQKHLLESTHVGMTMVRNRCFMMVNSCFARMLGYDSAEELMGQSTRVLYSDNEFYEKIGQLYLNRTIPLGTQPSFEFNLRHKDGSYSPFEVAYTLNQDSDGVFSVWTIIDISERIRREHELNSYRDQLLRFAERVPGMLYKFRLGSDGVMNFPIALGAVQQMLDTAPEILKISANHAFELIHPDDFAAVFNSIQISARDMTPWNIDFRLIMHDGRTVWRSGTSIPEHEDDGAIVWYGFINDITDQKRIQNALIRSETQQRAIFRASPAAMAVLDSHSLSVLEVNPAWERLLQRPAHSLLQHTLQQSGIWIHATDQQLIFNSMDCSPDTLSPVEIHLLQGNGQAILCRVSVAKTAQTALPSVLIIAEDITKQRAIEQEIAQLNQELEQRVLDRTTDLEQVNEALQDSLYELQATQNQLVEVEKLSALGRLVAGVAHEINTPVGNGLLAATMTQQLIEELQQHCKQGLKRSQLENFLHQTVEANQIVVRNLHNAAQLISTFKQVAVDQNIQVNRRCFSLSQLIADHLTLLQPRIRGTAMRIHLNIPESIELNSYPGPLGQIITNLITNTLDHAFEHQPAQQDLWIEASPSNTEPEYQSEAAWVELQFRDNGRGIPAEDIRHIFEPFFTTRLGRGGSGLGLHICHNAALSLGGRFQVSSAPGLGTCFTLKIPLTAPEPADL